MSHHSQLFKCLSEPVRLRIVTLLCQFDELCVCEFIDILELPQSVISRHISYLKRHQLLHASKRAQWVFYALDKQHPFTAVIQSFLTSFGDDEPMLGDLKRANQRQLNCQ